MNYVLSFLSECECSVQFANSWHIIFRRYQTQTQHLLSAEWTYDDLIMLLNVQRINCQHPSLIWLSLAESCQRHFNAVWWTTAPLTNDLWPVANQQLAKQQKRQEDAVLSRSLPSLDQQEIKENIAKRCKASWFSLMFKMVQTCSDCRLSQKNSKEFSMWADL